MVNFGPLAAEIISLVWGTPANFNGFCVLPSSLLRRCSLEANHTSHDVWPYPAPLHYIYIFGVSCPLTEFCPLQNSLYVQVLRSLILAPLQLTAWHSSSGRQPNFAALNRGRQLYSAARPSGWALAHISSLILFCTVCL